MRNHLCRLIFEKRDQIPGTVPWSWCSDVLFAYCIVCLNKASLDHHTIKKDCSMAGLYIFVFFTLPKLAACLTALAVTFLHPDICYSSASHHNSLFIYSVPWLNFGALTEITRPAGHRVNSFRKHTFNVTFHWALVSYTGYWVPKNRCIQKGALFLTGLNYSGLYFI